MLNYLNRALDADLAGQANKSAQDAGSNEADTSMNDLDGGELKINFDTEADETEVKKNTQERNDSEAEQNGGIYPVEGGCESLLQELYSTSFENTNVKFRTDTDLGYICQAVGSAVSLKADSSDMDEESQMSAIVENISQYFSTNEGAMYLDHIKEYSRQLSEIVGQAFRTLKYEVTPEVDQLTKTITGVASEYVARASSYTMSGDTLEPSTPMLTFLDLTKFESADTVDCGRELVGKYLVNHQDITTLTPMMLGSLYRKMPELTQVGVSFETADKMVNTLLEKHNLTRENSQAEYISYLGIVNSALNGTTDFNAIKGSLFDADFQTGKITEANILSALTYLDLYVKYTELDGIVDFAKEEQMAMFKKNMEILSDYQKVCKVHLALASERFRDCVAIGPTTVITEGYKEFTAQGGKDIDVVNYMRVYHNQNRDDVLYTQTGHTPVPIDGVKVKNLLEKKTYVSEFLASNLGKIKMQMKSISNDATRKAFRDTLHKAIADYSSNQYAQHEQPDMTRWRYDALKVVDEISNRLIRFEHENVEDAVYEYVLKTRYADSLVSRIWYKLGAEIMNTVNLTEDRTLDENAVNFAHFTVMSDVLSEYIAGTMVVPDGKRGAMY